MPWTTKASERLSRAVPAAGGCLPHPPPELLRAFVSSTTQPWSLAVSTLPLTSLRRSRLPADVSQRRAFTPMHVVWLESPRLVPAASVGRCSPCPLQPEPIPTHPLRVLKGSLKPFIVLKEQQPNPPGSKPPLHPWLQLSAFSPPDFSKELFPHRRSVSPPVSSGRTARWPLATTSLTPLPRGPGDLLLQNPVGAVLRSSLRICRLCFLSFFFNYQRLLLYNTEKYRTKYSYWKTVSPAVLSIHLSLKTFPFPSTSPPSFPSRWLPGPLALPVFSVSLGGRHTCSVFPWIASSRAMPLTPGLACAPCS